MVVRVKVQARLGIVEVQRHRNDVGKGAAGFLAESKQSLLQHVFLVDPRPCIHVCVRAHAGMRNAPAGEKKTRRVTCRWLDGIASRSRAWVR